MGTLKLDPSLLSLKRQSEIKELESFLSKKPEKTAPLQNVKKTLEWLKETYPAVFSKFPQKPLKIGIEKDIFKSKNHPLPGSKTLVRRAISFYVRSPVYLKVLLKGTHRYDLTGQKAGIIAPEHKQNAQDILKTRGSHGFHR